MLKHKNAKIKNKITMGLVFVFNSIISPKSSIWHNIMSYFSVNNSKYKSISQSINQDNVKYSFD